MSQRIKEYKWKNRILLIYSRDIEDRRFIQQKNQILDEIDGYIERDMVFLSLNTGNTDDLFEKINEKEKQDLRKIYTKAEDDFLVILIGKDGTIKTKSNEPLSSDYLFNLIDAMPMRKAEMRARKK